MIKSEGVKIVCQLLRQIPMAVFGSTTRLLKHNWYPLICVTFSSWWFLSLVIKDWLKTAIRRGCFSGPQLLEDILLEDITIKLSFTHLFSVKPHLLQQTCPLWV